MRNYVRTFVGVPLTEELRGQSATLQGQLATLGAQVKWVEADNLHVTLLFLGDIDIRDIHTVSQAVETAAGPFAPFLLSLEGVGAFPTLRRPRTIWVGIDEGAQSLRALFAALATPLIEAGYYRREDRDFTPHLTLGRVKGESDGKRLSEHLPKHTGWHGGKMTVGEVHLLSSELRRSGPVYSILSRIRLSGTVRPDGVASHLR